MPAEWDGESKEMGPVRPMGGERGYRDLAAKSRAALKAQGPFMPLSLSTDGTPVVGQIGLRLKLDVLEKEFEGLAGDLLGMGDVLAPLLRAGREGAVEAPSPTEFPSSEVGDRVETLTKRVMWARAILGDLGRRVDL